VPQGTTTGAWTEAAALEWSFRPWRERAPDESASRW
jgi:hypothetical protein